MKRENVVLQTGLKELSGQYEKHCREKGLKDSSIQLYMKLGLRFLKGVEDAGAESTKDINADRVMQGETSVRYDRRRDHQGRGLIGIF